MQLTEVSLKTKTTSRTKHTTLRHRENSFLKNTHLLTSYKNKDKLDFETLVTERKIISNIQILTLKIKNLYYCRSYGNFFALNHANEEPLALKFQKKYSVKIGVNFHNVKYSCSKS